MRKTLQLGVLGAVICAALLAALPASAQQVTATGSQNVICYVLSVADLSISGSGTITFAEEDPGTNPTVPATENGSWAITCSVRTVAAGVPTLTVAAADLADGKGDTIPIGNITFIASDATTAGGTNLGTPTWETSSTAVTNGGVQVGSFSNSGVYIGDIAYTFANTYDYTSSPASKSGEYTTTLNYTLTSP